MTLILKAALLFLQYNPAYVDIVRITIPSLVTKSSAVQRISSGQILTEILNLWSALKLTTTIQCFHWALCLMMIYHGTKFGCKRTISSEDIQKVIF